MTHDPTRSLGEMFQDALFAGFGTMPVPAAYRVMPFGDLPLEHRVSWDRAAVFFISDLSGPQRSEAALSVQAEPLPPAGGRE